MALPGRNEVVLEDPMGLPSVLLELAPVLNGMELELELPVAGPTSVLLLIAPLGMKGG